MTAFIEILNNGFLRIKRKDKIIFLRFIAIRDLDKTPTTLFQKSLARNKFYYIFDSS
jgi:hypothetical protein